jgi:copper chaperone CopZ
MIIMKCECGKFSLTEMEWSVPSLESEGCAEELQMVLEEITAVRGVRVNRQQKTVMVGFDADYIGTQQLKEAMNRAGFPVAPSREELYRLEIFGTADHAEVAAAVGS